MKKDSENKEQAGALSAGMTRREFINKAKKWSAVAGAIVLGGIYAGGGCGGGNDLYNLYCNGCGHNYVQYNSTDRYCNYSDYVDGCSG